MGNLRAREGTHNTKKKHWCFTCRVKSPRTRALPYWWKVIPLLAMPLSKGLAHHKDPITNWEADPSRKKDPSNNGRTLFWEQNFATVEFCFTTSLSLIILFIFCLIYIMSCKRGGFLCLLYRFKIPPLCLEGYIHGYKVPLQIHLGNLFQVLYMLVTSMQLKGHSTLRSILWWRVQSLPSDNYVVNTGVLNLEKNSYFVGSAL